MNYKTHQNGKYEVQVYANGDKSWWMNGQKHREDGPAYETVSGYKAWYLNGKRHRENGPAVEFVDGSKMWFLNGKRHREDGPAYEDIDGDKIWFLNDRALSEQQWLQKTGRLHCECGAEKCGTTHSTWCPKY